MEQEFPNPNDAIVSPFYPLHLYKAGTEFVWDGKSTDTLIVDDLDAEEVAALDGWQRAEAYLSGEDSPDILDRPAKEIEPALAALTLEELEALKSGEVAGKTRKNVIAMIDAAIDEKLKG